ncbi:MAG: hypothetical protein ACI4JN_06355, partial [Ruminococcus sp.]
TKLYIPYLDNAMIKDWDSTDNNPFCWYQFDRHVSNGEDEYYVLGYKPKGSPNAVLNSFTVASEKAAVYIWAEDHDIDVTYNYKHYYENCSADPTHDNVYDQPVFNTYAGWSKRQDTNVSSSRPKYMTKKEFEENAWLFCAGTTTAFDGDAWVLWDSENQRQTNEERTATNWKHGNIEGGSVHICPHVMDQNVTAIKGTASEESSKTVSELIGNLKINITHLGQAGETSCIPVYLEIRTCEKNLSNSVD